MEFIDKIRWRCNKKWQYGKFHSIICKIPQKFYYLVKNVFSYFSCRLLAIKIILCNFFVFKSDAAKNENEKVIVKFTSKKINSNLFPGREVFLQKLKKALEYWKKNEKAKTFLEKALFVMEKDEMDVLIISDYNTTGLLGAYFPYYFHSSQRL